jgi:hypothetical protein
MHMPVIPREEFKGATGQGDWADSLVELDSDFGVLLDLLDELGITDTTLVVFAGEFQTSAQREPLIPAGAALEFVPAAKDQ